MLNLENVYFCMIKDNIVIYKMSKESLDEFISENSLRVLPGYKEAELHMVFNNKCLKEAVLIPIYSDSNKTFIEAMSYITEELIENSLEEMDEDPEAFSKTLEDFHKF